MIGYSKQYKEELVGHLERNGSYIDDDLYDYSLRDRDVEYLISLIKEDIKNGNELW